MQHIIVDAQKQTIFYHKLQSIKALDKEPTLDKVYAAAREVSEDDAAELVNLYKKGYFDLSNSPMGESGNNGASVGASTKANKNNASSSASGEELGNHGNQPNTGSGDNYFDRFFTSYDNLANEGRQEFDWIVPGLMARGQLTILIAQKGLGKSDLLLQLYHEAVNGGTWLWHRFDQRYNVFFGDQEMGRQGIQNRLYDIREASPTRHIPNAEYARDIVSTKDLPLELRHQCDTIDGLTNVLRNCGRHYDIVVVDSTSAFLPAGCDENDNLFVRNELEKLTAFATDMNCAVVISHHTGKGVRQGMQIGNAARGATAWVDVPDNVVEMHQLSTKKSQEARVMIEGLSTARNSTAYGRTVRLFPKPMRLLFRKCRYEMPIPTTNLLYRYPLHLVKDDIWDIQETLAECPIALCDDDFKRDKRTEQAKERREDKALAILSIIEELHEDGILATCENVHPEYSEWLEDNGYPSISLDAFSRQCTKSGKLPFVKAKGTMELLYDPPEDEDAA